MMYVVLGMHKSGTSLIAQTLHESGIYMGNGFDGEYPHCKYEDKDAANIIKMFLYGRAKRLSTEVPILPDQLNPMTIGDFNTYLYANMISNRNGDWGFKFPDFTLCYHLFRDLLPEHMAIGVHRDLDGVLAHYAKTRSKPSPSLVKRAYMEYNKWLFCADIPVIKFEDYLRDGPEHLSHIIGRELKDCRRKKHG
jgi:hypothetical protein